MSAIPESPPVLSDEGRRELMARQGVRLRPVPIHAEPVTLSEEGAKIFSRMLADARRRAAREERTRRLARLFSRASAELGRAMGRWPCPSSAFLCPFYAAVAGALWLGLSARDGLPWLPREE